MVVGSTHPRRRRVMSGSTAERRCTAPAARWRSPPRGYRRHRPRPLRAVGAAFADTPEGHEAVRVAADLAGRAGLLTVYSVVGLHANWFRPEAVQPDALGGARGGPKAGRDALDRVVAGLPADVQASGELLFGEVVDELSMAPSAASTCWSAGRGATARCGGSCSGPSPRPWSARRRSRPWSFPGPRPADPGATAAARTASGPGPGRWSPGWSCRRPG